MPMKPASRPAAIAVISRLVQHAIVCACLGLLATPAQAIVNGGPDSTHECVGALHTLPGFQCTGTLIGDRWVLTTAACASTAPIDFTMGPNTASPAAREYAVQSIVLHPSWSGGNTYDFGMLLIEPTAIGEPECPALSPAQDSLSMGIQVSHVGYGLTSVPSGTTTQRRIVTNTLGSVTPTQLSYDLTLGGPCLGDDGGPSLTASNLVGGVVSEVDASCAAFGISGRVSSVYDAFIVPTLASTPPTPIPTTGAFGTLLLLLAILTAGFAMARRAARAS